LKGEKDCLQDELDRLRGCRVEHEARRDFLINKAKLLQAQSEKFKNGVRIFFEFFGNMGSKLTRSAKVQTPTFPNRKIWPQLCNIFKNLISDLCRIIWPLWRKTG